MNALRIQTEGKKKANRMQNKQIDPKNALTDIEPKTKAARIKNLHDLIESKINSGVHIAQIVEALNAAGLEINVATLKSYLYRLRRKKPPTPLASSPVQNQTVGPEHSETKTSRSTLSDIDSILNQDPASQAQELARYERLAKSTRRNS